MNHRTMNDHLFDPRLMAICVASSLLLPLSMARADEAMTLTARLAHPVMKGGERRGISSVSRMAASPSPTTTRPR